MAEEKDTEVDSHMAQHVYILQMIESLWDAIDLLANELGVDIGSQIGAGTDETKD